MPPSPRHQAKPGTVETITREIRACFQRLAAYGNALHADVGVTAAMRAVLEALDRGGAQTVAHMARDKRVSRQHIQALANSLLAAGLVASRPNPADKRAPLIALTDAGKKTFALIRRREKGAFAALARALNGCKLGATLATLAALHAYLDRQLEEGESDA